MRRTLTKTTKKTLNKQNLPQASEDACPPGVWTCSTGKRLLITKEAKVIARTAINKDENDNEDQNNCPPGTGFVNCEERYVDEAYTSEGKNWILGGNLVCLAYILICF